MPVPDKPLSSAPKTAREMVYRTMLEWIENGTLKPGEKILDAELADYFDLSRTPVREAMQLLADQKLIKIHPGKESIIAPIDLEEIKQIYLILGQLQMLAVHFAYPRLQETGFEKLEAINRQIPGADNREYVSLDNAFHQVFLDLADNPFLTQFCRMLSAHIARFQYAYLDHSEGFDKKKTAKSHDRILSFLKAGSLEEAEKAACENFTFMIPKIDQYKN